MYVSFAELAPWVSIALSIGVAIYTHFKSRSKDDSEKFESLERKIAGKADALPVGTLAAKLELVEDAVIVLKNDFKHLPDKDSTHRLELSISEMRTEMRGLSERMKPLGAIADRIQDAVMEKVMS